MQVLVFKMIKIYFKLTRCKYTQQKPMIEKKKQGEIRLKR